MRSLKPNFLKTQTSRITGRVVAVQADAGGAGPGSLAIEPDGGSAAESLHASADRASAVLPANPTLEAAIAVGGDVETFDCDFGCGFQHTDFDTAVEHEKNWCPMRPRKPQMEAQQQQIEQQ